MALMLPHFPVPLLPTPPSWYPGHMSKFTRMLPSLLSRTDIVLEIRDARLPLTSVNGNLEGALRRWRAERGCPHPSTQPLAPNTAICERIVVLNKRDLVPEWGMEPFRQAMASKFPDQRVLFASWNRPRDIRTLNELLVNIAQRRPHAETNVLIIGMPNVGKSTLLNALRNIGIPGPTAKAMRTSAQPGLTRALSTRLKLCGAPLVYAFDSPGVMLPFLGSGERGAERGVKLALIAGIKEGLYDVETLAGYLLYRLNILNPITPAYQKILPALTPPVIDIGEFLDGLGRRLGMLRRGGEVDVARAAVWFVRWWREEGGIAAASDGVDGTRLGWGFDFEWAVGAPGSVQERMEECIERYVKEGEVEEGDVSSTQVKKRDRRERIERRRKARQRVA